MLNVEKASKSFGETRAVREISFTVDEGTIFGLLGANGAGKTTTVRMILDIVRPDSGSISWSGTPVAKLPRRVFGYLPEERGLYPDMKVEEQLRFFAEIRGLSRAEARASCAAWLERLGVAHHRDREVRELSKGNQQKVQFIASVLHEPQLMVLDEPFSGLDPVNNELMKSAISELNARGTTILLSTHDMERAEELCESVALIHRSRLAFSGPLHELRRRHGTKKTLRLDFEGNREALLRRLPQAGVVAEKDGQLVLSPGGAEPEEVLREAVALGRVRRFEEVEPSLRKIFIEEVKGA
ncbi:putative ABC transporter ATP-binding protein YhaQ [Rubrobacter xylanophilus]|uniref:Putative ABC transporter ATP-binding protein YhaQ n=1 Tax=Rubrobacter xylanophilus TaxID=49319 RepID=A0A510HJD7_9ACTN|nr:ATP-binding cassette domain-containing protein [Rubrobacter xylanophilus]BBL80120.1 putative ABC transporter ATP-binding protein YhaQ [Rubrobacter xylanophilus]